MKLGFAPVVLVLASLSLVPAVGLAVITPPKTNPLAAPNKAVHDAQANLEIARKQLLVIRRKIEATFEVKPDYQTAKKSMDKAKSAYEAATRKVAATLEKNPEYMALIVKRDKAQAILDQESNPAPTASGDDPVVLTDDQIKEASKERTEAGVALINMEKSAQDNDPAIIDLKQKFADARVAWDAIQQQIDDGIKLDPTYPPAAQAITQAEAQLKQAREALAQAAAAQRQADMQNMKSHSPASGGVGR